MPTPEEIAAAEAAEAARLAAAAGGTPAGAPPKQPFAVFETAEQFNARTQQAARAQLREAGIKDSPEKVAQQLARLAELEAQAKAAEDAKKTETERMASELAAAKAAAQRAEDEALAARTEAQLAKVFAAEGVTNVDYGLHIVGKKLASLPDGEQLDEVAFIQGLKKDPAQAAALGIAVPGAPAGQQQQVDAKGATTTAAGAQPESKPTPPGGGPAQPVDAFAQPKSDFQRSMSEKYGVVVQ